MRQLVAAFCIAFSLAAPAWAGDLHDTLVAAMAGTATPGMAMAVIRDGAVADVGVAGVRRNDRPDPARIDDVWLIGSDGKAMTATMIARLVDKGVLSWSKPLSAMLPDLAAGMRPEYRPVTLTQLLSHHAGLPHDISDTKVFEGFYSDTRPLREQRLAYIARALAEAPVAPPGTKFSYSNTGFLIAAAIAERATGVSFEDLMRREVFGPLKMTSAGFGVPGPGQPQGHTGGKPVSRPDQSNPAMFAPPGNMYFSIGDWARFCLDQIAGANGGGRLLKPATYRLMQSVQPGGGDAGFGWGVVDPVAGYKGPGLTHSGSDGNWYALVVLFPSRRSGALVAANAGEDMGGDKADKAALKAVLPTLSARVASPAPSARP
ncbi:MAG TPA: serine hydrolase domain-containing protein [Caulobacteraceae bacterium]